jgi:hypothetical protein
LPGGGGADRGAGIADRKCHVRTFTARRGIARPADPRRVAAIAADGRHDDHRRFAQCDPFQIARPFGPAHGQIEIGFGEIDVHIAPTSAKRNWVVLARKLARRGESQAANTSRGQAMV